MSPRGCQCPPQRHGWPPSTASLHQRQRLLPPVDSLLETGVQNIVAFLEARANIQEYANNGARHRHRCRSVARRHTEHGRGAASHRETPPLPPRNLNLPGKMFGLPCLKSKRLSFSFILDRSSYECKVGVRLNEIYGLIDSMFC